jgi:short subunit dehydrogenase-like uncharacterized protein
MSELLIYGAYGYTGRLIVTEALRVGLKPVVAGRDPMKTQALAAEHHLTGVAFDLHDPAALAKALAGRRLVLHCAGPFSETFRPMAEACLQRGLHYLDITGEIEVFEGLAALDARAKSVGCVLLPGVGFDVVPTDCLALHLKQRLPGATHLALAFMGGGGFSRGTRRTMLEGLGTGGKVRRDGRIAPVPAAWKTREVDFGGGGRRRVVTIPWGDVATAWYSTDIANIETYTVLARGQIRFLVMSRYLGWLLQSGFMQKRLRAKLDRQRPGPDDATRERTQSHVWGEVRDGAGKLMQSRLSCANGYSFTARSAVAAVQRVLAGGIAPGFQTPAKAFGAGFVESLGAVVEDLKG